MYIKKFWSLGVTLYVLKFGRAPYEGKTVQEIESKILNDDIVFPNNM